MTQRTALALLRLVFGCVVIGAVSWQLRIHMRLGYSVPNFFSFFTNLSNLFAAIVFLYLALRHFTNGERFATIDLLRFMAATNMIVVGVVFAILLRNVDLGSLLPWINTLLHYVMPTVVALDWMFDPPQTKLRVPQLMGILIFPALYLAYTLVRGSYLNWYPYPFLNPANVGGYLYVALYAVAITVTFILAGFLLMIVGNKRMTRSNA